MAKSITLQFGEMKLYIINLLRSILLTILQCNPHGGPCYPLLGVTYQGDLIFNSNNFIQEYFFVSERTIPLHFLNNGQTQLASKIIAQGETWIITYGSLGTFRSTDDGKTWIELGQRTKQCLSICLDSKCNIIVGTYSYAFWGGLNESQNMGKTWTDLNPLNYGAYFSDVQQLKNGSIIAAGSYGDFIYDGNYWRRIDSISLAYSQYISKNGTIYVNDIYNGIYISKDNGETWIQSNSGLNNSYFFGFGESITGRVFAGAWPSGSYYTDNDGKSWNFINSFILSNTEALDFKYKKDTIFAASTSGLLYSVDNGMTWESNSELE